MKRWPIYVVAASLTATFVWYFMHNSSAVITPKNSNSTVAVTENSITKANLPNSVNSAANTMVVHDRTTTEVNYETGDLSTHKSNLEHMANEISIPDEMQLFINAALKSGSLSSNNVTKMFSSKRFDEYAQSLPYLTDNDIQVQLDIESELSKNLTAGSSVKSILCGSYVCLASIDYDSNHEVESSIHNIITSDPRVNTLILQRAIINGQNEVRAIFTHSNKINSIELAPDSN